jgi:hypothetical protein
MAYTDNTARFNKRAPELFALLYSYFPQPCKFDASDFDVEKDEHGCISIDDVNFVFAFSRFRDGRMAGRRGLRTDPIRGAGWFDLWCGLTGKGLAVLRLVPDTLQNDTPLGEQIQTAVKGGASKVAMKLVDKVLDAGIRYTMAHAGLPLSN